MAIIETSLLERFLIYPRFIIKGGGPGGRDWGRWEVRPMQEQDTFPPTNPYP